MIKSEDISFVVQGAVDKKLTPLCLASIRKHFPKSQIILSTWEGTDVKDLDFDDIVISKDPSAIIADDRHGVRNNVNRQILSTKNGLFRATRSYSVKIRSDISVRGSSFLKYFDKFPQRTSELCILKKRVLICNLYTANPEKTYFLFHPSDWFYFGLTPDVINIWDIPLAPEPETSRWFKTRPRPSIDKIPSWDARFVPEQYIWISFLKKNGYDPKLRHITDFDEKKLLFSELSMVNNLTVLDYSKQLEIDFLKYDPYMHDAKNQQNHLYWLEKYKQYCDPHYRLPLRFDLEKDRNFRRFKRKMFRFFKRFYGPISKPLKWFFAPLMGFYWLICILGRAGYIALKRLFSY